MQYGLIGEKLGHSFSKTVHSFIADYEYELKELTPEQFDLFFKEKNFRAVNVTIPYKEKVIPFLDEIEENAAKIGAVNTVVNMGGRLYGYNTDFYGLKALLCRNKIEIQGKKVLIFGTGATSKTAHCVVESMGARTVVHASVLQEDYSVTYSEAQTLHSDADVIINTTPCGMYPQNGSYIIDVDSFTSLKAVVDVIYNPINSYFTVLARQKGIKAVGGLYMLVCQAVLSAEKFLNTQIGLSKCEEIYKKILKDKQNLVLIGMPSSGKTTLGKLSAKELSKCFVDSDEEIERLTNRKISDLFAEASEKGFREIEASVIAELSRRQSSVIATGGGVVLNKRNIELLKQNGILVFIDRPLDKLISTPDRPLSNDREKLEKLYKERYGLYKSAADVTVSLSDNLEENTENIIGSFLNENSCN